MMDFTVPLLRCAIVIHIAVITCAVMVLSADTALYQASYLSSQTGLAIADIKQSSQLKHYIAQVLWYSQLVLMVLSDQS